MLYQKYDLLLKKTNAFGKDIFFSFLAFEYKVLVNMEITERNELFLCCQT